MLGRCRLRRGVSLEVIVEEDDQSEVTYDHSPLEDYEEDDDSDMECSSSPTGEGDVSEVLDEESERRRRRRAARARRRTVVGIPLDRMRSVSCEALTLLDTSDLDSCHSEWDEDDQNSNYVTLNRPISRKRILQNNSRSDSEDSGVEYHSNEEDPILEKTSSNADDNEQHNNMCIPQVKVTQIDTDTIDVNEPDPLPEEVLQEQQLSQNQDDLLEEDDDLDENQQDDLEFELSHCVTPTVEETFEQLQLSGQFNQTDEETWIKVEDVQVAEKDQASNISQAPPQKQPEDQNLSQTQEKCEEVTKNDTNVNNDNNNNKTNSRNRSNKTNNLLENPKLVIVETTPSVPIRKAQHNEKKDPVKEELRLKRQVYNIRNKEVRLEELPTPNTVSSVKELFENLHQNIDHFESFRQIGWFRDIKSNTSSKILRFTRSKDNSSSSASNRQSVPRFSTLPRLPSQHTNTKSAAPRPSPRSSLAQRLAAAPVVTSLGNGRGGMAPRRHLVQNSVTSSAHGGVALRKPQVSRGFNVLKALAEDPRRMIHPPNEPAVQPLTFHHPVTYSRSAPITGKRTTQLQQQHQHTQNSYMDRSDCESLSSDTSEDSGVSGGSSISSSGDRTSSSISSSIFSNQDSYRSLDNHSYRSLDSYSQDPSFKWIDPKIMSKIRAKGTTVIFFGPKHKKNSNGGLAELEVPSRCSTPVFVLQPQAGGMAAPQMAQT